MGGQCHRTCFIDRCMFAWCAPVPNQCCCDSEARLYHWEIVIEIGFSFLFFSVIKRVLCLRWRHISPARRFLVSHTHTPAQTNALTLSSLLILSLPALVCSFFISFLLNHTLFQQFCAPTSPPNVFSFLRRQDAWRCCSAADGPWWRGWWRRRRRSNFGSWKAAEANSRWRVNMDYLNF